MENENEGVIEERSSRWTLVGGGSLIE